jgi:excisionase family DNA binding protein
MSRAGIYRNLATGKIEGQKDGRTLLIDRESLDRYLESLPKAGGKVTAA